MIPTPPEPHFQHHGVQVETRETWAARRAAEAATQAARERQAVEESRRADAVVLTPSPAAVSSRPAARRRIAVRFPALAALLAGVLVLSIAAYRPGPPDEPERPPHGESPRSPDEVAVGARAALGSPANSPYSAAWSDAPTIDPSPAGWWCVCYKTIDDNDQTACRRASSECEALWTMVQTRGSAAIRRGSASGSGCRHVARSYPWEALGHRHVWRVSAFSDAPGASDAVKDRRRATQAAGVCAI